MCRETGVALIHQLNSSNPGQVYLSGAHSLPGMETSFTLQRVFSEQGDATSAPAGGAAAMINSSLTVLPRTSGAAWPVWSVRASFGVVVIAISDMTGQTAN